MKSALGQSRRLSNAPSMSASPPTPDYYCAPRMVQTGQKQTSADPQTHLVDPHLQSVSRPCDVFTRRGVWGRKASDQRESLPWLLSFIPGFVFQFPRALEPSMAATDEMTLRDISR